MPLELVDQPKQEPESIRQNSFVRDLVSDPYCEIPAVKVFVGYLGGSSRTVKDNAGNVTEGWVRLYFTLDFTDFIDVRLEDIAYHERSTSAMLPRQGTILWVNSDATIWHTRVRSRTMQAGDFLRGPIVDEDLADSQQTYGRAGEPLIQTPSWGRPC